MEIDDARAVPPRRSADLRRQVAAVPLAEAQGKVPRPRGTTAALGALTLAVATVVASAWLLTRGVQWALTSLAPELASAASAEGSADVSPADQGMAPVALPAADPVSPDAARLPSAHREPGSLPAREATGTPVPPPAPRSGVSDGGSDGGPDAGEAGSAPGSQVLADSPRARGATAASPAWVAASLLTSLPPEYTEMGRRARIEGEVRLRIRVDARGQVTAAKVLRGLPMGLDGAAQVAVRRWRYAPATRDGVPTASELEVAVRFALDG